jgi:serine protease
MDQPFAPTSTDADRTPNRRTRRRTAALALVLSAALGASAVPAGLGSVASAAPAAPESGRFSDLSTDDLWHLVGQAGGRAVVGLKDDGEALGFAGGRSLVDAAERAEAEAAVRSIAGVEEVSADDARPVLTVDVSGPAALAALRSSDHVQYVEPSSFDAAVHSSGCTGNDWNANPAGGDVSGESTDSAPGGDRVPRNFAASRIQEAWGRSPGGAGATVGVLDTGIFPEQAQLRPSSSGGRFDVGSSAGRTIRLIDSSRTGTVLDTCNHGTRSVGSVAGPLDGQGLVGVAYRSNVVSTKIGADVFIDMWETGDVVKGIRDASAAGARIISMAFGTGSWNYDNIRHEIQHQYYNRGILFLGAAGTTYCAEGVIFPARLPEVVAVTGTDAAGRLHPTACGGREVEVAANIDGAVAPGRRAQDFITWGGSSAATAVASGTAALIWSKYPSMSRDQVRQRLVWSGKGAVQAGVGSGIIDAYKAVGGLHSLTISGGGTVAPGTTVTLTARPAGDGPYTYRWNDGRTSQSITVTAGAAGTRQTYSVTVQDTGDDKPHTRSVVVESAAEEPIDLCTNPRLCR